ncbi:GNVR domain-containing protein [Hoeflea sp. IMCC20628]|uniref:GNVR domain-containing protein n=1 Tax=Hoeflea sp. IMCC20628 TaxID=1620421 RepID=UPI0018CD828D|nr:GNVR domain-containing protein [Hoeflea sp. IMCC20628]
MPHNQEQEQEQEPAAAGGEKFGDRISRLIGTITPEGKPRTEPREPEIPPVSAAEQPRRDEAEADPADLEQAPPRGEWRPANPTRSGHDDHYHWHSPSHADGDAGSRPLLDASILISSVWGYRRQIAATTVAGAVLGVLVALSTPHKYYAESRLFIDPREIRVTEDDIRNQQLSTEAMLAITDSQLQILASTGVLEKVVQDLGLERDPEFNGSLSVGGIGGGITLIKEIFTGKSGSSEAEQKSLEKLRDALSVSRDAKTFVIIIGVQTRDAEKSALIANQIVETYLDAEGQAQSSLLERTSESIDTRLNALRSDLNAAEREVERFKAENGLVGVGGQYIDDKVILALSDQLATARAMKVGIKVKADNLARVKPDDVLSGAFPEELLSANLTALRKQYTDTRSSAETLATRLGPKHPQYIAAKSALNTISAEISAELRRIVASSQTELQRAVETEQELASQMAVAKNRSLDQSVELVTLRELERKATATRGIYEAFLTRSRETSERSNLSTRNIRVISAAEAPLRNMGPSRKLIAIGGMFAGFFAGFGLALLAGAVESFRSYNSGPVQARFQAPPFGAYPQAPDPGPRTPPGGPSRRTWTRRDEDADALQAAADEDTSALEAATKAYASIRARAAGQRPAAEPSRPEPAHPQAAPSSPDVLGSTPVRQQWKHQQSARPDQSGQQHHEDDSLFRQPSDLTQPGYWQQAPLRQQPNPASQAPQSGGDGLRLVQPVWTVHPAQHQTHTQPAYPSGPASDPYAAAHQAGQPQYDARHGAAGQVQQQAPQYQPVQPQPALYQASPYQPAQPQVPQHQHREPQWQSPHYQPRQPELQPAQYQPQPHYQPAPPQAQASHYQTQALHQQTPQPYPAQSPQDQPWLAAQPQAQYPVAPPQPAPVWSQPASVAAPFPTPSPVSPAPVSAAPVQPQPAANPSVDQIRRNMDMLKSRIVGYGSARTGS